MSRGQTSIQNSLRSHVPSDCRLLLAVSGGKDSVVLLHAAQSLARELNWHLEIAHLDHGLRTESTSDALFVESLAKRMSLACHLRSARKVNDSENTESWGRRVRYEFFTELIQTRKLDLIVTAHHADDVAETLLMRLVSNKEPGELARYDAKRRLVRPFLDVTREMIETYAHEQALEWREDLSNANEAFLRNKVRHSLMPLLREQFDPRISEVLSLRAQALAEDASALDAWAYAEGERLTQLTFGSKDWLAAARAVLNALEPAVQWRLARDMMQPHMPYRLGRSKAESLVEFLLGDSEGIELPTGVTLRRKDGGIALLNAR